MLFGGIVQNAELSAPPDVATSNWLPLGESFGFVIVSAGKTTKPKQPAHKNSKRWENLSKCTGSTLAISAQGWNEIFKTLKSC
jgi:hypothetical protein